jgi:hypothetical protein
MLTLDHAVKGQLQEVVDTNSGFYKRLTGDGKSAKSLVDWLSVRLLKVLE